MSLPLGILNPISQLHSQSLAVEKLVKVMMTGLVN